MLITIKSNNNVTRKVALESINSNGRQVTWGDIATQDAVIDFFDEEPSVIKNAIVEITKNGVTTPVSGDPEFRAMVLGAKVVADAIVKIALDAVVDEAEAEDEDEDEDASGEELSAEPKVTVAPVGGMGVAEVYIQNGVTTVYEAIHNGCVRDRLNMSDEDISNSNVNVNNQAISEAELKTAVLHSGDTIVLFSKKAHTNG